MEIKGKSGSNKWKKAIGAQTLCKIKVVFFLKKTLKGTLYQITKSVKLKVRVSQIFLL